MVVHYEFMVEKIPELEGIMFFVIAPVCTCCPLVSYLNHFLITHYKKIMVVKIE